MTDNDSHSDLVRAVEKSSKGNKAVFVGKTFQWWDWKSVLADEFCPILGTRSYNYFRFRSLNPGVVFLKEIHVDDERPLRLCRNPTADFSSSTLPLVLAKCIEQFHFGFRKKLQTGNLEFNRFVCFQVAFFQRDKDIYINVREHAINLTCTAPSEKYTDCCHCYSFIQPLIYIDLLLTRYTLIHSSVDLLVFLLNCFY